MLGQALAHPAAQREEAVQEDRGSPPGPAPPGSVEEGLDSLVRLLLELASPRRQKRALRHQERALRHQERALRHQERALRHQERALRHQERALRHQREDAQHHPVSHLKYPGMRMRPSKEAPAGPLARRAGRGWANQCDGCDVLPSSEHALWIIPCADRSRDGRMSDHARTLTRSERRSAPVIRDQQPPARLARPRRPAQIENRAKTSGPRRSATGADPSRASPRVGCCGDRGRGRSAAGWLNGCRSHQAGRVESRPRRTPRRWWSVPRRSAPPGTPVHRR
jgi:hypothetical protein